MKIVIDDKEVEGVFMENAEGSDINHLDKGNKLLMAKSSSFESPEALQQVTAIEETCSISLKETSLVKSSL